MFFNANKQVVGIVWLITQHAVSARKGSQLILAAKAAVC